MNVKKRSFFVCKRFTKMVKISDKINEIFIKKYEKKKKKTLKKVLIFYTTSSIIHDVDCEDVRGCWNTESRCHDGVPGNSH